MSDIKRLVWQALIQDVVDTSATNPSLLTLASRSPQRMAAAAGAGQPTPTAGLFTATAVAAAGAPAGQAVVPVVSAMNYRDGMWIWLGDPINPEVVEIAPGGVDVVGSRITLTANLNFTHAAGSLISPLPTIITDVEPREVVETPDYYWHLVIGPEHEFPSPQPVHRAPLRLRESMLTVKIYDSNPSHKLAEDIRDRLDYLLDLGEAGCTDPTGTTVNPSPLLGTPSPTLRTWIEKLELVDPGEPHFDYSSLVTQLPMHFKACFSKVYA